MNISEMLARNAQAYPEEVALVELVPSKGFRKEITWREFDEQANRLANTLMERGIGRDDTVIHLMRNSINWLIAYFGIIRTGAWATPLNFRFTGEDIKYCTEIAESRMMILGQDFVETVESIRPQLSNIKDYILDGQNGVSDMERFEDVVAGARADPPSVNLAPEDECGLYFTSGTTGPPKPILLTHKNMECAAITEQAHHFQTHDDNFILMPPLYHTGAKMHWFGSLLVGGKAVLLNEISPQCILETVHNEGGTIVWLLVPWAHDIVSAFDRGELNPADYDLSRWRLMHIGAQPVPPSLVRHWRQYFPNMQYDTNYGLTESTGPGCVHLGIGNEHKLEAIGKPGYNWQARIVDEEGKDVAPGEVGELIVKGDGVMKEYYKNPEKTAQTIKDGWLYTGDMSKMDEDGFIYIVDRKKDIIISGGENVYPVEIENVLQSYPGVQDAAVIGTPDERLGELVTAVIQPAPGEELSEDKIASFCEENLQRYKRPRRIIFGEVPRNPTGKIEKPRLREMYGG
ncbi:MAG: class I adenylate-forming enzyme family protein [Chloroflexota bacterium]